MTTHALDSAFAVATRIAVLVSGRLREQIPRSACMPTPTLALEPRPSR
jgi:hypothetical protein